MFDRMSSWLGGFGARSRVSIDFGSSAVKLLRASVHEEDGHFSYGIQLDDHEPLSVPNGQSPEPDDFADPLKALVERAELSEDEPVIAGIPLQSVIVRRLDIPTVPDKDLEATIRREAEDELAFPLQDVAMDYHLVPRDGDVTHVTLVMVKREKLWDYMDLIYDVGLRPAGVDVSIFALFNFYRQTTSPELSGSDENGAPSVLVDVGHTTTNILAFEGNDVLFARSVAQGGLSVTRSIVQKTGLGREDAEALKQDDVDLMEGFEGDVPAADEEEPPSSDRPDVESSTQLGESIDPETSEESTTGEEAPPDSDDEDEGGDDVSTEESGGSEESLGQQLDLSTSDPESARDPSPPDVRTLQDELSEEETPDDGDSHVERANEAARVQANRLIGELRQTFDYLTGEMQTDPVDSVVICGGGSQLRGLREYLQSRLELPCRLFDPGDHFKPDPPDHLPSRLVSFGLQLRNHPGALTVEIDLLPEEIAYRKQRETRRQYWRISAGLVGLLALQLIVAVVVSYVQWAGYLAQSRAELRTLNPVIERIETIQESRRTLTRRDKLLRELQEEQVPMLALIEDLARLPEPLRQNSWIQKLSFSSGEPRGSMTVAGVTRDFQSLSRIYRWMETRPYVLSQVDESQSRSNYRLDGRTRSMVRYSATYRVTFESFPEASDTESLAAVIGQGTSP